jgi:hypothetical protein
MKQLVFGLLNGCAPDAIAASFASGEVGAGDGPVRQLYVRK